MLRLVYSNRTEELLDALAEALRAERAAGAHPLAPVDVVVPNRNMEQYVRLGLAERLGVAANLRFRRLERFVADLVATSEPGSRLVDADALTGGVLAGFFPMLEGADLSLDNPIADTFLGFNADRGTDVRWAWEAISDNVPAMA